MNVHERLPGGRGTLAANWQLALVGAGTAGLAVLREIFRNTMLPTPERVLVVDGDTVGKDSGFTCPEYRSMAGLPKPVAAARLVDLWSDGSVRADPVAADLEDIDWSKFVDSAGDRMLAVVAGIDRFESRLSLLRALRQAADGAQNLVHIQIGLDRDSAVVSVFSSRWKDNCPACYLPFLPGPEPCLLLDGQGLPARGALQGEAHAGAATAVEILAEARQGWLGSWLGRRIVVSLDRNEASGHKRQVFTRRPMSGCLGAHWPVSTIAWPVPGLRPVKENCHVDE